MASMASRPPPSDDPRDPGPLAALRCPEDGLSLREEGANALRCERGHRHARRGRLFDLAPAAAAPAFGRWRAATYDLTFDLVNVRVLFGSTPRRLVELHRAAARAAAAGHGVLLDVGCGTARWALPELVGTNVVRYFGLDPSLPMLDAAEKRAARSSKSEAISLVHSDAAQLPFGDATIDAALSSLGMQFVPDHPAALAELRRVLCPGGQLFLVAPALGLRERYDRRYREREEKDFPLDRDLWPGQLSAAGFVDVAIDPMGALLFTTARAG
jgi:SAM-dependent methyltransferase